MHALQMKTNPHEKITPNKTLSIIYLVSCTELLTLMNHERFIKPAVCGDAGQEQHDRQDLVCWFGPTSSSLPYLNKWKPRIKETCQITLEFGSDKEESQKCMIQAEKSSEDTRPARLAVPPYSD